MTRALLALVVLACFAVATTSFAPRTTAVEALAAQDAPVCKKCNSTGKLPCTEHTKQLCEEEADLLYCSFAAKCPVCAGAGCIPCPDCNNAAARKWIEDKKAKTAARGVALGNLDKEMGRQLRKGESQRFVLVWELDRLKVDKKWLDDHELLHLYLKRLEDLHADFRARMEITDKEFVEKCRVFVWWLPKDQLDGSLRFCKQGATGGVKLMGNNPSYSVCGNKQNFQSDEKLHRNIVHCVTHLLLSAQAPIAWIGNIKAGWADEGLAHWFEDRYWGICDTYCYQEANTNVDFKSGKWKLAVRRMVDAGTTPSIAEVFEQNIDTLTLPMNAASFSYVDYLITRDGAKFSELVKKLKQKIPTRDALKQVWGMSPIDFEAAWKAWVLQTYPTK